MINNSIHKFQIKYYKKLNEPIVKCFLENPDNYALFEEAVKNPNLSNRENLDIAFKRHFRQIKIINYINKLIHYYSIDFDRKISLNKKRFLLKLDDSTEDLDKSFRYNTLISSKTDLTDLGYERIQLDIRDHVSDTNLFKALNSLSNKQLTILNLIYIYNYKNNEAAKILKESEQVICYHHKRAITKLKEIMGIL